MNKSAVEELAIDESKGFIAFWKGVFSDTDKTPSSTRILLFIFSFFVMAMIWMVLHHMVLTNEIAQLTIWIAAFPGFVTALIALIVAPYTISKASTAVTTIASSFANIKPAPVVNADVAQVVQHDGENKL